MMSNTVGRLALFATLPLLTSGFTVTQDNDGSGQTVAQAIFTGQGLSVVNWDLSAASGSYGSFADGPFGIGSGGILATGPVSGALPGGNRNVDNGHSNNGEQDSYCGPNSQNALVLYAGVFIDSGYNGVQLEFILATEEDEGGQPDSIGLLAYTDNEHQLAVDGSGNRITAQSSLAKDPIAIRPPNSVTGYSRSTPPLIVTLPLPGGNTQLDIFLSICDINNAGHDSALLIKGTACTDCELTPNGAEINYVKETTTLQRGEQAYTSTIPASGTASGTFIYFVAPEETTTTALEQPTSTDATTTTYESTETTTTDSTTATATTTSGEVKSTSAEAAVTTKTTTKEPTTTAESTSTEEPTTASQSTDTNTSTELGTTVESTTTSDYSSTTTVDEPTTSSTNVSIVSTVTTADATAVVTTDTASTVATDSASQPTTATLRESTTVALTSSTIVTTSEEPVLQSDTTTTMSSDSNTASWSSSETSSTSSGFSNQATTSRASSSSETSLPLSSTEISSTEISSTAAVSQETSQTLTTHSEPYTTSTSSLIFSTSASGSIDSSSISVSTPASTISMGLQGSSSAGSTELVVTKPSSSQTTVYSVPYNSGKPGQSLVATTVTTITYTIVNPYKPSELTVTEYCSTLSYQPCTRCAHQPIPSVSMTTQVVPCNGCGKQGENEVTVTVPCAAATEPASNDHPYKKPKLPKPQGSHQSESLVQYAKPTSVGNHAVPGFNGTLTTAIRHARPTAYGNGDSDAHHYNNPANGTPDQQQDHHEPSSPEVTSMNYGNPSLSSSHSASTPAHHTTVPEVAIASGGRLQMNMFVFLSTFIGLIFFL
ncbi:hypothetical protein FoTM2_014169 [Fusarium oxysporum f. sp. vasinfectum]|uniref:Uncharacterized protein n=1 Tax=Fusarium oxysporum f. sp. vasinfectum 25433 TaxID=1089449 RepID=X0MA99_FUSOX|nr:hypothetical protein FOTG_14257 [Fusarium oxysporum f. sp. vasinfectum 25433]KAK2925803.1 hypothetical protein FoTM2_014169 [Fusarium oxysporum f. sp. vasinfectum]